MVCEIDELLKKIDEKELVKLVQSLVRIHSVSGNEAEMAKFESNFCEKIGIKTEIDRHGNFIGTLDNNQTGPVIALNSHMDTVDYGEGWNDDPTSGKIDGNLLYGRGSADCKASIACHIMAVKVLRESGVKLGGKVIIMHPVSEEVQNASKKGTFLMMQDGFKADMAINGEATNMQIDVACNGMLEMEITTYGKNAHGSNPEQGINAIDEMCTIINELNNLCPGRNKYTGVGSIVPGVIHGGERSSVVPDLCTLKVSRFIVPGEDGPMFLNEISYIIANLKAQGKIHDASVKMLYESHPYCISEEEAVVKHMLKAYEQVGYPIKISGTPQHDDADYLCNMGNIPTVIFGPGRTTMGHVPNECVEIDDVITACKIYVAMLYDALKR